MKRKQKTLAIWLLLEIRRFKELGQNSHIAKKTWIFLRLFAALEPPSPSSTWPVFPACSQEVRFRD